MISKHFVVFTFFFISGIFVYLIILKIIESKNFCRITACLYLLYPYLLGHGLFNPKDIPFLTIWLICTYISFTIFENLLMEKSLKYFNVILISFFTAYLLSIRVTGVLVFIQYLFTLIIFINIKKYKLNIFLIKMYKQALMFIF